MEPRVKVSKETIAEEEVETMAWQSGLFCPGLNGSCRRGAADQEKAPHARPAPAIKKQIDPRIEPPTDSYALRHGTAQRKGDRQTSQKQ